MDNQTMSGLIQDLIDERLNRSLKTSCGSPFQDVHLSNKAKTMMGMPLVFHVLFFAQALFLFFFFFPTPLSIYTSSVGVHLPRLQFLVDQGCLQRWS